MFQEKNCYSEEKNCYPEEKILGHKKNYGSCFNGGGMLATIFTYAVFYGLQDKLDKIKYFSCVSGAAWHCISALYYNKLLYDDYLEPENCYLDILKKVELNTYGKLYSKVNLISDTIKNEIKFFLKNKWEKCIYEMFFKNTYDEQLLNNYSKISLEKFPYLIVNSSLFYDGIPERRFSIEFTQDYINIPIHYFKDNIDYGGYMTSLNNASVNNYFYPYNQSSFTSSFNEAVLEMFFSNRYQTKKYQLINPSTRKTQFCNIVDGALMDNCGIISLLRRKVKYIHVNLASHCSITSKNFTYNKYEYCSFYTLFKGNQYSEKYGIFDYGIWDNIYSKLMEKLDNGDPLTILLTTEILDNKYFELTGYGEITFLFHIQSCSKKWYNSLPFETQDYITSKHPEFPYISLFKNNFDIILIKLIYNQVIWDIKNSREYIDFFVTSF